MLNKERCQDKMNPYSMVAVLLTTSTYQNFPYQKNVKISYVTNMQQTFFGHCLLLELCPKHVLLSSETPTTWPF